MALSDWLYANTDATHRIAMERLAKLVGDWLQQERGLVQADIAAQLKLDYAGQISPEKIPRSERKKLREEQEQANKKAAPERQVRHLQAAD